MSTEAPCSCAAKAAQNAALPAPTTMTSYSCIAVPTFESCSLDGAKRNPGRLSRYRTTTKFSIRHHAPLDGFTAAIDQRALVRALDLDLLRRRPSCALERDRLLVGRQPVMLGAVERCEGFE